MRKPYESTKSTSLKRNVFTYNKKICASQITEDAQSGKKNVEGFHWCLTVHLQPIPLKILKWDERGIKVHWKHVLNLKLKGEVENWSFWVKKVSNVFYQFSFPIQYFANFWIIHKALRSVSCSRYLCLSRHKSSKKKKKLVSIIRPRGLLHCQKKGVNSKTLFLVTKFGFVIQFSFFCFTRNELIKWIFMDLRLKKVRSSGWRGGGTLSYFA